MPESLPAWGDRECHRFAVRLALFKRRGLDAERAERLADRLAARDQLRDDRRCCAECGHVQPARGNYDAGCFSARQGWLGPGVDKRLIPIPDLLQRCPQFVPWKP